MLKVSRLIESLSVVDENILAVAAGQPLLFVEASRYRVAKMRQRSRAEAALEACASELGLRFRTPTGNEQRITEGYVKTRLLKHPRYRQMKEEVDRAEEREEFAKLLLEAYRMRRDAIKIIADAQTYEGAKGAYQVERDDMHRRLSNEARKLQERRKRANLRDE